MVVINHCLHKENMDIQLYNTRIDFIKQELCSCVYFPIDCLWSFAKDMDICVYAYTIKKKVRDKFQGVPQSQAAAHPRHEMEEETGKTKQAQIEQTFEKH